MGYYFLSTVKTLRWPSLSEFMKIVNICLDERNCKGESKQFEIYNTNKQRERQLGNSTGNQFSVPMKHKCFLLCSYTQYVAIANNL